MRWSGSTHVQRTQTNEKEDSEKSMKLVHFSPKPIIKLRSYKQKVEADWKPVGLWVSDESAEVGWHEWCVREEFRLDHLKYPYSIELKKDAKILYVSNLREFDAFNKKYNKSLIPHLSNSYLRGIDWFELSGEYQGIVITPYLWERRNHEQSYWYHGWDCASGCIWNSKAIKKITLIEKES